MISIIKYLYEDEGITGAVKNALDPETFKAAGSATKRLAGRVGEALSKPGETAYDLTHDKETGASLGGRIFKTGKTKQLENIDNNWQLAKGIRATSDKNIQTQWGEVLKKKIKVS